MSTRQPSGLVSFPSQGTGFPSAVRPIPSSNLTMSYPLPPKSSLMPSTLNFAGSVLRTRKLGNPTSAIQTPATTVWTTAVFYSTTLITVTSCAAAVTDFPASSTVIFTSIIPAHTTVSPTAFQASAAEVGPTASVRGTFPTGAASSGFYPDLWKPFIPQT
ncbi:hypothetical protein V2W45_1481137 [Cenococcum geophilum]